ncbi:helix-turn-helix domain-containing protein [Novosphingobium sp. 1949]|uniref:Helix-turn-helix domain-containing protein n=1 Tax=Novosphingobium organovorum TaxID=2930092 RepID=A0ABT0BHP1_9SPHN|nr:helix-turn-helix transcriptional regulator [Novosphingobium organovorum]MCJ2184581.1 helix-turn-helix domain-containing protein [Novosphingobium organovorum]
MNDQDRQDHFAYCVQLIGGTTSFARRLRIDERAIRRFINGERPISDGLLQDTAKALRALASDAAGAADTITTQLPSSPDTP